MVTVASTSVTYDTNVFTNILHLLDFQVSLPVVQSNQAWAGQNIGIQFQSTVTTNIGGVWDIDNVRLTELIYVPNFSFESQVTPFADPRVDSWQKPPQPPTFPTNVFGPWDTLAGVFANSTNGSPERITNADSNQLAYIFAYPQAGFFQDNNSTDWTGTTTHTFNSKFKAGRSYTLAAAFTSSSEEPLSSGSTLQMSLYYRDLSSNMVTVAATTVTYDTNVFTNLTQLLDFTTTIPIVKASDPWAGQNIGISFQALFPVGGVWDLDNVRLTETVANYLYNPRWNAGQFTCTLQSEPNLAFEILTTTNLAQPISNWSSIGSLTNISGTTQVTDPGASPRQRFYRARRLP
jgi:hypothetical protein